MVGSMDLGMAVGTAAVDHQKTVWLTGDRLMPSLFVTLLAKTRLFGDQ